MGTEFELDDLLRMDTASRVTAGKEAVTGGMSPNEVRAKFYDLGPVTGGDSPLIQQQNFSLEALAKRDAKPDPFASSTPAPAAPKPGDDAPDDNLDKRFEVALRKAAA